MTEANTVSEVGGTREERKRVTYEIKVENRSFNRARSACSFVQARTCGLRMFISVITSSLERFEIMKIERRKFLELTELL